MVDHHDNRGSSHYVLAAVAGLIAAAGVIGWVTVPWAFIADDCYFYAVIARHLALNGEHTFNGLMVTNGVHPLWQYLLAGYAWVVGQVDPTILWHERFAVPLSLTLVLAGGFAFHVVARRIGANPVILALVPATMLIWLGLLYSEAHLSFCMLALFSVMFIKTDITRPRDAATLGALAALVFLARLDNAFIVPAAATWLLLMKAPWRCLIWFAVPPAVLGGGYMLSNVMFFGGVSPVSGWMKSSFPIVNLQPIRHLGLATTVIGYQIALGWVPLLFSALALSVLRGRSRELALARVLFAAACFQAGYIILFTRSHTHWYWYYVLPMMTGALCLALLERQCLDRLLRLPFILRPASVGILLIAGGASYLSTQRFSGERGFPSQAAALDFLSTNTAEPVTVLVSDWPGYIAFRTHHRVMAADLLTANRPFYEAMAQSDNCLQFLLNAAADQGKPLRYIIHTGNHWLVANDTLSELTYMDPRSYPKPRPLGQLEVGPPVLVDGGRGCIVWELRPALPASSPAVDVP